MKVSSYIKSLNLYYFRNHLDFQIETNGSKFIFITGHNGVGKTNVLEAISLFAPGRGFRNCKFDEVISISNLKPDYQKEWAVISHYQNNNDEYRLATGYNVGLNGLQDKRSITINKEVARRQTQLLEILRVIWLVPSMDGLFIDSLNTRRRFLDRMTYNFIPSHASAVAKYEYMMRSRNKILSDNTKGYNELWLNTIEEKMSRLMIEIASSRLIVFKKITDFMAKFNTSFLKPIIYIKGFVENLIQNHGIDDEELRDIIITYLKKSRNFFGRIPEGVQNSDLIVKNSQKNIDAKNCSTGEQKAMIISLILAQVGALKYFENQSTILLLDDLCAHIDKDRINMLLEEIYSMNIQTWITSVNNNIYSSASIGDSYINLSI